MAHTLYLAGDIGGTNSRFALFEEGSTEPLHIARMKNKQFRDIQDAIEHYIANVPDERRPTHACLAVASPVTDDRIKLTNCKWEFSIESLRQTLGLEAVIAVNDFTALAMSVPLLGPEDYRQIGSGEPVEHRPVGILGPGTGLGVSGLVWCGQHWVPLEGEGGHAGFAPADELEIALLREAWKEYDRVSMERFLCGHGITFLYRAIARLEGRAEENLYAVDITSRALEDGCSHARETLLRFCAILGSAAGDLALTLGAFGGIYIGGGITPKLGKLFFDSDFRKRFEAKGRFAPYMQQIPTYLLTSHTRPALIGAAAVLDKELTT